MEEREKNVDRTDGGEERMRSNGGKERGKEVRGGGQGRDGEK